MIGTVDRTTREDGIIISTIRPPFLAWYGEYETTVTFDNQGTWHIAEVYGTLKAAREGHKKYVDMIARQLENKKDWL